MSLKVKIKLELEIPLEVAEAIQKDEAVPEDVQESLILANEAAAKEAVVEAVKALPTLFKKVDLFTIFYVLPNGRTRTLQVQPKTTVRQVAEMIAEKEGIPASKQFLRHRGKLIWGSLGDSKMAELNIGDCSTIHLAVSQSFMALSPPPLPSVVEAAQTPSPAALIAAAAHAQMPCRCTPKEGFRGSGSRCRGNHRGRNGRGSRRRQASRPPPPPPTENLHISITGTDIPSGHTVTIPSAFLGLTLRGVAGVVASVQSVPPENVSLYAGGRLVVSRFSYLDEESSQLRVLAPETRNDLRAIIWKRDINPRQEQPPVAVTEGEDLYD